MSDADAGLMFSWILMTAVAVLMVGGAACVVRAWWKR